jgi:hypothetical protein
MAKYSTSGGRDLMSDGPHEKLYDSEGRCVAMVYRDDRAHRVTIEIYDKRTPAAWLGLLYGRSWVTLDPFEDGTPLAEGKLPRIFRKYERSPEAKARAAKVRAYYWAHRELYARRARLRRQRKKAEEEAKRKAAARRRAAAKRRDAQREKGSSGS